jgi:hypothetical protein
MRDGPVIACEVVWTEVAAVFPISADAIAIVGTMGVGYSPMTLDAVVTAADIWKQYRRAGGKRNRVAADFLIGAHALRQADRLLTRDHGFYRTYFSSLTVVDPTLQP